MISNFKKKGGHIHFLFIAIITFITLLIFYRPIFNKGILLYSDNIPTVLNMSSFNKTANYIFTEKYMGLTENPIYIVTYFLIEKLFYLISFFVSKRALSLLWVILPSIFFNITLYFVFFQFVKQKKVAFLQTILFIFSLTYFDSLFMGGPLTIWSHIGSLLFFTFFVKYINRPKNKYLVLASIFSMLGVLNIAYFYCVLLACSFFLVFYFLIYKINPLIFFKKRPFLILFIMITIFIHFFWLLPYIMSVYKKLTNYGGNGDNISSSRSLISTPLNNFQFVYAFRPEPTFAQPYYLYKSIFYKIVFFIFLLGILINLLPLLKKDKKTLTLFCLFMTLFTISLGNNSFFWNALIKIPGWFFLRDHMRIILLLYFIFILLVGNVILNKSKTFRIILILYICFSAIIFLRSNIFAFFSNSVIPQDYFLISEYLSKDVNKNKPVLFLPEFDWYVRYRWMGGNFFTPVLSEWFIENPIIMSFIGRSRVPNYFWPFFDNKIKENDYAQYLGIGGIKYILLHKDGTNFNYFKNIEIKKLDNAKGIKKIIYGKNLVLYEVLDNYYRPIIYSTNNLRYKKINPTKYEISINLKDKSNLIFNLPYNPNWKIFLKNKNKEFDCKLLEAISVNISKTDVSRSISCQSNQTFFKIDDLTYMTKSPIFESTHQTDNKYANKWVLDKKYIKNNYSSNYYTESQDGSINVNLTLFYKPQSYLYLGVIISIITLLSCIIYLIIISQS